MAEAQYWHGLVAACTATVLSNPFELVKLRQQTGHLSWRQAWCSSSWPRCHFIGSGWTMARALTYSPLTLYLNGFLLAHHQDGPGIEVLDRVVAGAASGAIGAVVCNPIEVLRVRRQHHYHHHHHLSSVTFSSLRSLMMSGIGANVGRCSLWAGTQLTVYGWLDTQFPSNGLLPSVAIATVSTLAAVIVGHPFDTIKSRQMVGLMVGRQFGCGFTANVCRSLVHGTVLLTVHRTLARWGKRADTC